MHIRTRVVTAVFICGTIVVLVACSTKGAGEPSASPRAQDLSGGVLRLALLSDFQAGLDPAKEYEAIAAAAYRCCLLRTLYAYAGVPTEEGGSELREDLAAAPATVSDDGLTWTIPLKAGINYAPPLQDVEVTAADFVRALEREADPKANVGGYSFYFSVIEGFDQFAAGKAATISGLTVLDPLTLQIRVSEPTGDLGYRLALAAAAPIPPFGDARMGTAEGHQADYGRFLVSTGPYMIEGSPELDFSAPTQEQVPVAGYVAGRSLVLVRNPSWDASTDELRPAYVDEIQIQIGGDNEDMHNQVRASEIDLVLDGTVPPSILREYSTDPALESHLHLFQSDAVSYLEFNVAQPPFDDLHVRKAVNLVIDKAGLRTLLGGELKGVLTGHVMPNSLQNGLLENYDPYATQGSAGDLQAAREEMALSRYGGPDGLCQDTVCDGVLAFTINQDVYQEQAALISSNLAEIGINLDVHALQTSTMYSKCAAPEEHMGICLALGWGKDYPDGNTFAVLFNSASIFPSCCNDMLVGASPELLEKHEYATTSVPNVDSALLACAREVDEARIQCWADVDRMLMEEVVPWVPWLVENSVRITSDRVVAYSFDQSSSMPALERIAVTPDGQ